MLLKRLEDVRPTDLADALKVSVPFASQILNGKRGISFKYLDAIAEMLNLPVPELFVVPEKSESVTAPVTSSGIKKGDLIQTLTREPPLRAKTVAVHPPEERPIHPVVVAQRLNRHAAALSALARRIVHGYAADRHPPTAARPKRGPGDPGRRERDAGGERRRRKS